jgi:DNA polymerase III delta prime subunit
LDNRRKRRRTRSSIPESCIVHEGSTKAATIEAREEWENQLRAAAYGEESTPTAILQPIQAFKPAPGKHDSIQTHISEPLCVSNQDKDTLPLPIDISKPRLGEYGQETEASDKQQTTSRLPQKMLAISSGGKLVSPRSYSPVSCTNSKRKKLDINLGDHPPQKIVKIKYGSTDESRKLIAQKIQQISSRTIVRSKYEIDRLKASEPVIVSKPTHPFFLGAGSRTRELNAHDPSIVGGKLTKQNIQGMQDKNINSKAVNTVMEHSTNVDASANLPTVRDTCYSLGKLKPTRHPGAMEPIWPPRDMAHVQPLTHETVVSSALQTWSQTSSRCRKLKYPKVNIGEHEEILRSYSDLIKSQAISKQHFEPQTMKTVCQSSRKIMTGLELQRATASRLAHKMSGFMTPQPAEFQDDLSCDLHSLPRTTHKALLQVFKDIPTSRTAFDRFECETQDWAHKYAPKRAEEVLQSGSEPLLLRDWLKSLTVTSVNIGKSEIARGQDKSIPSRRHDGSSKRKKRRRAEELDGFVISSDEETVEMKELANPEISTSDPQNLTLGERSIVRTGNMLGRSENGRGTANAVVISGPHGCGKTAAVYAVARELEFEVFEINSGSRRSGKDILERVGDMTKNHLVSQGRETQGDEASKGIAKFSTPDDGYSHQDIAKPLWPPKAEGKKKPRGRPGAYTKHLETSGNLQRKQNPKQSLILLEEVDVLFEEDRQFWATTLDLILHSKRPVIMTCTDESLVPLDQMILFAVLRFTPPPEPLAVDYLLLVASSEGHLLSRKALSVLFKSKNLDLRASITELHFFCQMAIGDTKGGLEWMLIPSSPSEDQPQEDKNLRVVSVGTYNEGLSHVSHPQQNPKARSFIHSAETVMSAIEKRWNADSESSSLISLPVDHSQSKQRQTLQKLVACEQVMDAISAADTHYFSEHRQNGLVGSMNIGHVCMLSRTDNIGYISTRNFREIKDEFRRRFNGSPSRASC